MNKTIMTPQLGHKILVVIDSIPGFLDALRTIASHIPQNTHPFFTLLCCCPTHYWEHGGADTPDAQHDVEQAWIEDVRTYNRAEQWLIQARAVLEQIGIPPAHIVTKTSGPEEDNLMTAVMAELRRGRYSGIIICRYHEDIVNRLLRQGVTDFFRQIPKVEVWTIDVERMTAQSPA